VGEAEDEFGLNDMWEMGCGTYLYALLAKKPSCNLSHTCYVGCRVQVAPSGQAHDVTCKIVCQVVQALSLPPDHRHMMSPARLSAEWCRYVPPLPLPLTTGT